MRIISGEWKGRKFTAPKNLPTRPTTDFAKEALFNILNHRFYLNEIKVLDLFAGIGSISLEFASRGAQKVDAVEKFGKCVDFINQTAEKLEADQITVYPTNVFSFLKNEKHDTYDIIFADPPFDLEPALYNEIIQHIFDNKFLEEAGLLIIEHGKLISLSDSPHFVEHKKYGNLNFSFFEAPISDNDE